MAPQRKDRHRLSFSVLRAQNRDKLFKVSVPHVLEMRKRELKPRWVQEGLPHLLPSRPLWWDPLWPLWRVPSLQIAWNDPCGWKD